MRAIGIILTSGHRSLERPPAIGRGLWEILIRCWQQNPLHRPTMLQVHQAILGL